MPLNWGFFLEVREMKEKVKKLYFTNDFSPENVKKLQGEGWIIRNAQLAKSDSFVEQADEYGGDVPDRYKPKTEQVTVSLNAELTPELQQAIDDAEAECEKVVAENNELKKQISILNENLDGLMPVEQFDAVAQKLSETEDQLNKEREVVKKLTSEKDALLAQVKDLEAKVKKLAATELKAAKAAELDQPKE